MDVRTKTGDDGQTSLLSGERVSKDDLRMEVNGTLDELDCHLGEAILLVDDLMIKANIYGIQETLKKIMAEVVDCGHSYITEDDVGYIDSQFENDIYASLPPLKNLVIPGGKLPSVKLDICRTVARRAERRIVTLSKVQPVSEHILVYINRVSDLLFLMARATTHLH